MDLKDKIIQLIRSTIYAVVPDAKIILFGSRARNTHRPDSDWDVLVLVDAPKLLSIHKDLDYELWQKGLEFGQEINTCIRTQAQWDQNISLFKHHVTAEGILL